MGRGPIRQVSPMKRTVTTEHSTMSTAFVPNWDRDPGPAQHVARVIERENMGQKMTPKGDVRNKKR